MPVVDPWSSHDEVVEVIGERHQIVDLVLLKLEGFDDVLNLHGVEVHKKDLVVECDYYLILPYLDLHDLGIEGDIGDDLLCFCVGEVVLSSKMASRLGRVKGVSFSPTSPMRLVLLISYTNCRGVPKSRSWRSAKGWVL